MTLYGEDIFILRSKLFFYLFQGFPLSYRHLFFCTA